MTLYRATAAGPVPMTPDEEAEFEASRAPQPPGVKEYTDAVQSHLDSKAQERNYDNIVSACSYAGAPNPFQAEGSAFVSWRGDVWAACYQIMGEVQGGQRPAPTIVGLIAELPELVLL
jgi:hypothetical protein